MIRFLIYLFESGMCLTLLYLVYFLFLRKETYFTFNRIYLISILVFSLLFPLIHINFTLPKSKVLESRVEEINNFKNYYEYLISLSDPDYANSFTLAFQQNKTEAFDETSGAAFSSQPATSNSVANENIQNKKTGFWASIKLANILLHLYLLGIFFFTGRLLLLFRWLNQTIKKYGSTTNNGMNLVKIDEEVPPFSFFRFVFVNKETTSNSGFTQILTHEKVHISQRHSYDLLLAHAITIIQWFNPFVWLINNAMKTNHEYIADRNVVEQGYELFDYQTLLLKQIISIRSVELVNNFNLINIKKRIAMMTKIKSGLSAQLKALVIIPAAILVFFFFSEISFAHVEAMQKQDISIDDLNGFWKNESENTYGQLLNFKENSLQILEDKESYKQFDFHIPDFTTPMTESYFRDSKISKYVRSKDELISINVLAVKEYGGTLGNKPFYIAIKNNKLIVEWSETQVSVYTRVKLNNSLEQYSDMISDDFEPVNNEYYRLADKPERTYHLLMNRKGEMMLNNERLVLNDLQEKLGDMKVDDNPFASSTKVAILVIDANCQMKHVSNLFTEMRESNQLLHILSVKPKDEKVPEILYHNVGIPRLLPPKNAKLFDEEEVKRSCMTIIRIDLSKGVTPEKAASIFDNEIQKDRKYVILLSYENETTYKEYLSILDEYYQSIFAKRDNLANERFNLGYDDLAKLQQKEIRKSFPMVLVEQNVDYVAD